MLTRRTIINTKVLGWRLAESGRELIVCYAVDWSDDTRDIMESRVALIGAVLVHQERMEREPGVRG